MKKTAVLIYPQFCNFEIAPALELLALSGKPITLFAKTMAPVRSEEGLTVVPDCAMDALDIAQYDSLLLPGASDIREAIGDEAVLAFIRKFDGMVIGAISIAPLLLFRAGMLTGKPFMAGVNPEDLFEEGYAPDELALMKGWDACLKEPVPDGYIRTGNIVTSVSYGFVRWALAFGRMLGIDMPGEIFGL